MNRLTRESVGAGLPAHRQSKCIGPPADRGLLVACGAVAGAHRTVQRLATQGPNQTPANRNAAERYVVTPKVQAAELDSHGGEVVDPFYVRKGGLRCMMGTYSGALEEEILESIELDVTTDVVPVVDATSSCGPRESTE